MHYKKVRLSKDKTMDEHRYIMEQKHGRKLLKTEEVHHKDGNKRNNSIDNLEILDKSKHASLHAKGVSCTDEKKEKLRETGRNARPHARLGVEDVKEIKRLLADGLANCEVAKRTGNHRNLIHQIKKGERWGWVTI